MHKLLTTLILTILSLYLSATVRVTNLSIEGRQDSPLGIDVKTPSLGWRLMADDGLFRVCQTQYHILVASSELLLSQDKGDIWDHTTVSDQSQWIPFCGKKLSPNAKYWWKVRAEYSYSSSIDGKKTKKAWTEWSAPSSWSMGLMHEYRWKGYWIGMEHANPWDREDEHSRLSARYFRRTFPLASEVKRATLHICGLGLYEAYIDGCLISKGTKNDLSRLGDIVMTPAPTDYRKSIIYNTFDITPLLQNDRSKHCIAVTVSNGRFYTMQQNKKKHKITNFGYPCLRANIIIEYSDGKTETIATDDKLWRLNADGAIRSANEYDGEIYDARKQFGGSAEAWTSPDFDDSSWQLAQRSAIPSGSLIGNLTPPMRILDTLRVKHSSTIGNAIVMDFGQNYAGWTMINTAACRLSKGDTLRIRYAERLNADGSLYTANLRHAESTDYYIADGKTNSWWAPRFTTHGGRYIEVSVIGKSCPQLSADDVIGEVVSDDMARKGQFSCGNMTLNRLMAEQGATTIWELWNGDTANPAMNSGNHVMLLGDLIPWMFRDLGGIAPAEAGYKRIRLAPRFELEELSQATASYECPYGMIKSSWQKTLDRLHWEISIPCNTVAEVQMPHKVLTLGSGHYVLDESLPLSSVPADKLKGSDMQVKANEFLYEKAEFPSCHACTIAELTNGDLLAAYFGGSYESCPDVCIYTQRKRLIKRDAKHGNVYETKWSAPVKVADGIMSDSLRKACYNPVLFQIPDGDLLLHYKIGKDVRDWTGYQMRSTDNGYTWSSQRDSIPAVAGVCPDSLLGAIKNQPIFLPKGFRCKNGTVLTTSRIIAPTSKETAFASKVKPGQWRCYMEISEDDGRSWTITPQVPQNNNLFRTIQPTVLIHRDGRLQLLARTAPPKHPAQKENALVATSWSDDGGLTWSEMEFVKDLPNNNSGIDAVTLPDGSFAIIYNPFGCVDWKKKTEADRNKPLRNPLWVATSSDGIHWTPQLSLESSPISQYSYPSMIVGSDGTLHCIYTWRRQRVKYQRIGFQ